MPKKKHLKKTKTRAAKKKRSLFSFLRLSNPFAVILITLIALSALANIKTTENLIAGTQSVLSESEQSEEQKQAEEAAKQAEEKQEEAQKQAEEQQKESSKQTEEQQKQESTQSSSGESEKSKTETTTSTGTKIKTESEGQKQETEIETADGQKIKTKIEDDGTTKIEIENGTIKLKYRIENGQIILEAENEDGEEVELEDEELEDLGTAVEDELEDDDIKLESTDDDKLALSKNQVSAITDFPLSINVETKELIVTTPDGQKVVTILPDEAVENLLATGIINKIETPASDTDTQDQLGALTEVIKLEVRDGEVVYKINGEKNHKLLGFIPVATPVTAFVSADTGDTVAKQQSLLSNIIDLLSL